MVAEDFLRDPQVRQWLGGVEPAWTLLTLGSLRALRREPSAVPGAIRIANDLNPDEVSASPVARNALILLRHALECGGLALTATGNLSRAAVAEMRKLIEWPHYDQAEVFQFSWRHYPLNCVPGNASRRNQNQHPFQAARKILNFFVPVGV